MNIRRKLEKINKKSSLIMWKIDINIALMNEINKKYEFYTLYLEIYNMDIENRSGQSEFIISERIEKNEII